MTLTTQKGTILACALLVGGYFVVPMIWKLDSIRFEEEPVSIHKMEVMIPAGSEQFGKLERIRLKEDALQSLLHGEQNLAATVERFLWVNELDELSMEYVRHHFAGSCDEEKTARQVLSFAKYRRQAKPQEIPQSTIDKIDHEINHTDWANMHNHE